MTSAENLAKVGAVTNLTASRPPDLDDAVQAADAAGLAAGVSVRELTELAELEEVVKLYAAIWGRDDNPPMTLSFTLITRDLPHPQPTP